MNDFYVFYHRHFKVENFPRLQHHIISHHSRATIIAGVLIQFGIKPYEFSIGIFFEQLQIKSYIQLMLIYKFNTLYVI